MAKGYIFDFNGTLFWDTDYHNDAWMAFARKHGFEITKELLREKLHGKVNREIFKIVLDAEISDEKAYSLSEEKEEMYREIVRNLEGGPKLAAGAVQVLDTLKGRNTPMAIATSSVKSNVDFYRDIFNLNRWFSEAFIIYDDGSFASKPAPDIFLISAERLKLQPGDCTVVEDSVTGIKAAQAAGIGQIFLIASGNHLAWDYSDPDIQIIEDFTDFLQ